MRKRTASTNPASDCSDDDSPLPAHPDDESIRRFFPIHNIDTPPLKCNFFFHLILQFKDGKELWAQIVTIYIAATLTYGYTNSKLEGISTNVQIAIMTVITLVGASPISSSHLITASIGVFAGGHNIIGSVGLMEEAIAMTWVNYLWLFVLCLVVGLVWRFGMVKWKLLDGYSGRLGTTVFLGANLTMLAFCPLGVVSWNRYYYGLTEVLNSAEDSIPLARAWFEEAELAIGYVIAVIFLGVVGGGTRIMHNNYLKKLEETNEELSTKHFPLPLNNILISVLWALLSMLLVIVSGYENASILFNGFAVGSYVAMASLQRLPSIANFAVVSLLAAGWGLALTPFFVGFPGKSGFTSMLGDLTCCLVVRALHWFRVRSESSQSRHPVTSSSDDVFSENNSLQPSPSQEAPESPSNEHHFKPKTENSVITKHQRRQQRKLKHLQLPGDEDTDGQPKLHHRAWSAVKAEADDGEWHHSLKAEEEGNGIV